MTTYANSASPADSLHGARAARNPQGLLDELCTDAAVLSEHVRLAAVAWDDRGLVSLAFLCDALTRWIHQYAAVLLEKAGAA